MELKDICQYISEKVATTTLTKENYISTENMLPDKGGIVTASGVPFGNSTAFSVGDVLVSNIRPYFKKIWQANRNGGCSADVLCFRANSNVDNSYFYYLLSQQEFFDYVMSGAKGCKMPRGDKRQIMQWKVELPPLDEQRHIASVLLSLDDKIELNRRINGNLEQQAQALFKAWFVDFEPFKDGKFVDSELGKIPAGWKVGLLNELIELQSGFAFKSDTFVEEGEYRLITIKAVQDGYLDISGASYINEVPIKMPHYCFLQIGDMLLSLTGNVGRVCLVGYNNLLLNQRVAKIKPIKEMDRMFAYTLFRRDEFKNRLIYLAKGTAQLNLSPIETIKQKVIIPPRHILNRYGTIANIMYDLILEKIQENIVLTEQRDTLLPRLMSGELNVNTLTE